MSAADGYQETLITVAGDSPTDHGLVPTSGVAAFQYALLAGHPQELTQADVLFRTAYWDSPGDPDDLRAMHWDEFFAPRLPANLAAAEEVRLGPAFRRSGSGCPRGRGLGGAPSARR